MEDTIGNMDSFEQGTQRVDCRGERMELLPERAVFLPRSRTLIVADTHFGKAATFRSAGIPIPSGATAADLARLSGLLRGTKAQRLVILGDFLHARAGRTPAVMDQLHAWRGTWADLPIDLVIGNHDRSAGLPPTEWNLEFHAEPLLDSPFVYAHHPLEHAHGYTLCGHLHPAYSLRDRARRNETIACFWLTPHYAVLPAFGRFTGSMRIRPDDSDQIFLVGPQRVIPLSRNKECVTKIE